MKKSLKTISAILAFCLIFSLAFILVACNGTQKAMPATAFFSVKIVDIDGEVLADDKNVLIDTSRTLLEMLSSKYGADYSTSQYGTMLKSLKGTVQDKNWALMIYENGQPVSVGIDGLTADNGDNFEFKVECWNTLNNGFGGTMDESDVNIDKTIYKFMKTGFKALYQERNSCADSQYWLDMAVNMMKVEGYDANVFKTYANETFNTSLANENFLSLSGANWGKFFYAAKANGLDLTNFKSAYQNHINNLSGAFSPRSSPFEISFAKGLNLTSSALETMINNTEISTDTSWGPDGAVWQNTALSIYEDFNASDFVFLTSKSDWNNATSTALPLMLYAANNMKIRDIQKDLPKDCVELLFEKAYDKASGLLLLDSTKPITDASNMSVNQIYASIMAYKAQRDSAKAVNLFA